MKILLTGGAGFIGSHTLIELTEAGHEAVVVDNLDNSSPISLKRVAKIIGKEVPFYEGNVRNETLLNTIFDQHDIQCVIHFAGLKAVGESVFAQHLAARSACFAAYSEQKMLASYITVPHLFFR